MKPTLTAATLVRNSGKSFQIQIRLFFAAFICILLLGSIIIDPNTPLITTFCFQAGDNLDNGVICTSRNVLSKALTALIPVYMHCSVQQCCININPATNHPGKNQTDNVSLKNCTFPRTWGFFPIMFDVVQATEKNPQRR